MTNRTARMLKDIIEMIEQGALGFATELLQELLDNGEYNVDDTRKLEKALNKKILPDDSFEEYIPGTAL